MPTKTKTAPAARKLTAKQADAIAARKAESEAKAAARHETVTAERATAAALIAALDAGRVSVPIKSVIAYGKRYNRTVTAHPAGRNPSVRQASALAVAALANKKRVADKTTFARTFSHAGGTFTIENGALSDAIAAGLCTYDAETETITITNAAEIAGKIGNVTSLTV